jgi:hypothetical protein
MKPDTNNDKAVKCWTIDRSARALRLEPAPGRSLLLPYEHFAHSELEAGKELDTLKLVFAGHEVVIRGQNLGILELALQKHELANIRLSPTARVQPKDECQPLVVELVVSAEKTAAANGSG